MQDLSGFPYEGSFKLLKKLFDFNCTHISGNLIIFGLHQNAYGIDPDVRFFDSIKEISGFLIITNSSVKNLSFRNLAIIHGQTGRYNLRANLPPSAVVIRHNYFKNHSMQWLNLENLRAVRSGDVYIYDNVGGCQITPGVSWPAVLEDPLKQNVYTSPPNSLFPTREICSQKTEPKGRCLKTACDWCYQTRGGKEFCCDATCIGGCSGPGPEHCLACRDYKDDDICVDSCPKPATVQNYMLTLNVDFKYRFERHCVQQCPNCFLPQMADCVQECSAQGFHSFGGFCIPCEKSCPKTCSITHRDGLLSGIDGKQLFELANCTVIQGNLIINEDSFTPIEGSQAIRLVDELWALQSVEEITGFVYINLAQLPGQLYNLTFLENLRKIGGSHTRFSLAVFNGHIEFPGLHSLRDVSNGEIIFADCPELCYIQTILNKENVPASRDLTSDQTIPFFKVRVERLPSATDCLRLGATCHPSCDPTQGCWGPRREDCVRCKRRSIDNTICVDSCDDVPGFYEVNDKPNERNSKINPLTYRLSMAKLAAGMRDSRESVLGKMNLASKGLEGSCGRCHPECAGRCHGPEPDQCYGDCKHAIEDNTCVRNCSYTRYLDTNRGVCLHCQGHCHQRSYTKQRVCSGPGHHPGPGGCEKCERFLEIITFNGQSEDGLNQVQNGALLCMRGNCPSGTFSTFELVTPGSKFEQFAELPSRVVPVCRSCHPLCAECSSYSQLRGNGSFGCLKCRGHWFKDVCLLRCPTESTFQISLVNPHRAHEFKQNVNQHGLLLSSKASQFHPKLWTRELDGNCLACHQECRHGCWGHSEEHCFQCANVRVWRIHDEKKDKSRRLWLAPNGVVYHLNDNASQPVLSPTVTMEMSATISNGYSPVFTCMRHCPSSLPISVVDPFTGDQTCQADSSSSAAIHVIALSGDLNQPKRGFFLGIGLIITMVVTGLILVCCCSLFLARKTRAPASKRKPISRLIQFIDKVSGYFVGQENPAKVVKKHFCSPSAPCGYVNRLQLALQNPAWDSDADMCSCGLGMDDDINSDHVPCKYCEINSDTVFIGCKHYSPTHCRSNRQPNMGRLIMINSDDLIFVDNPKPLGTGAFGAVYQGIWKRQSDISSNNIASDSLNSLTSNASSPAGTDSQDPRRVINVAIKILNETSESSDLQALLEEAKVMASVSHPNCLPLLGLCLAGPRRCLVSEYIPNGSLDCYLRRYTTDLPNDLLLYWTSQIAAGMIYLQANGIIHRDLATRNVLVKRRDLVQITDFGLAKMLNGDEVGGEVIVQSGRVPVRWLAIETLTSRRYSFKTDVWAYGVTMWEIFTFGQRPYATIATADIKRHVLAGGRLSQPDICTLMAYQKLLLPCWFENPDERVNFCDLLDILNSKKDVPDFFLHTRSTSYLIIGDNSTDSRNQINAYSSLQLSDFPLNQVGSRTSCPPQKPFISASSRKGLARSTSHESTSSPPAHRHLPLEMPTIRGHRRFPRDGKAQVNEHFSIQSLGQSGDSGFNAEDLVRTKTQSTFMSSLSGNEEEIHIEGESDVTAEAYIRNQTEGTRDWPRAEANPISNSAGGYVQPHWPADFNRYTNDTETPTEFMQLMQAHQNRLACQPQTEGGANLETNRENGVQEAGSHRLLRGEYVEPMPLYRPNMNDS